MFFFTLKGLPRPNPLLVCNVCRRNWTLMDRVLGWSGNEFTWRVSGSPPRAGLKKRMGLCWGILHFAFWHTVTVILPTPDHLGCELGVRETTRAWVFQGTGRTGWARLSYFFHGQNLCSLEDPMSTSLVNIRASQGALPDCTSVLQQGHQLRRQFTHTMHIRHPTYCPEPGATRCHFSRRRRHINSLFRLVS